MDGQRQVSAFANRPDLRRDPDWLITRVEQLEMALFDLVHMERTQTPDMSGKRRKFAHMQNGAVLAECLDNARKLLGLDTYDNNARDPHHGGKIMNAPND